MRAARRFLLSSVAVLCAVAWVVRRQVRDARAFPHLEGFAREHLDGAIGEGTDDERVRVAWIGDSLAVGVGAQSPHGALPRLVCEALGFPVVLSVLGASGAKASDALVNLLPLLPDLHADWVFIHLGSNDVVGLTPRGRFRAELQQIMHFVQTLRPQRVVVLGIPEFGIVPLLAQPLRAIAGVRGHLLDDDVRAAAKRYGATYVDIARDTAHAMTADPVRLFARDRYHLSDQGYATWARAVVRTLERAG